MQYDFHIRVTGILIENGKMLLVQQHLSENRRWSLPGGRLEQGETLEQGVVRELKEETGLNVSVARLVYVCDMKHTGHTAIHVTFLLNKESGELALPSNEKDENPIYDVKFVSIDELPHYGFSARFTELAEKHFPNKGNYVGDKENIGLGL